MKLNKLIKRKKYNIYIYTHTERKIPRSPIVFLIFRWWDALAILLWAGVLKWKRWRKCCWWWWIVRWVNTHLCGYPSHPCVHQSHVNAVNSLVVIFTGGPCTKVIHSISNGSSSRLRRKWWSGFWLRSWSTSHCFNIQTVRPLFFNLILQYASLMAFIGCSRSSSSLN